MPKSGRNEPCSCGSGRKAKHCCGVARGPAVDELARAFIAGEALIASATLAGCEHHEFETLWDEMLTLPRRHLSLHLPLPKLVKPELGRLIEALEGENLEGADDALVEALASVDTPPARAALARAVVELRENGHLDARLAAVAVLELASRSQALVRASLVEATSVAAGVTTTPGGIIIAPSLAA
jgi:hypothetical protein